MVCQILDMSSEKLLFAFISGLERRKNSHKINSDRNSVGKQQATSSDNTKMMILQDSTYSL